MNRPIHWLFAGLLLIGQAPTVSAQITPEEHASHHPDEAAQDASSATPAAESGKPAGGMGGAGMGDMMKGMGNAPPKELYPSLMELPDLPLEKRAEVKAAAHERMREGAAQLGVALENLARAAPGDDFRAMQAALEEMREGLTRFESGIAAHRALAEGSAPRNVALQWFKREMNLLPPASADGPSLMLGLSPIHFFTMFILVAFAAIMIWMYYHKMKRAEELVAALASSPPAAPPKAPPAPATAKSEPVERTPSAAPPPAVPPAPRAKKWSGRLNVCRIFQETHDIRTFRMVATDGGPLPFTYLPGQFLTLAVEIDGKRVKRSYTIASSPTVQDYVEISVKREEKGLVSRHLHDTLEEGSELEISAPAGRLTFTGESAEGIVLIGGGVGITPMMSVIRYLTDRGWPGPIDFLYSCRTTKDFVFREELEFLQRRNPNLNVLATMTRESGTVWMGVKGRLTRELITSTVDDITKPTIHICGPPPMMDAIEAMLADLGAPKEHVHLEAFGPAKQAKPKSKPAEAQKPAAAEDPGPPATAETATAQATVTFRASGKSGPLASGETVLDAADALGVEIDSSCRAGSCGSCEVKLLSGHVDMEVEDGLEPDQKAAGFILACQATSDADVEIDA